MDNDIQADLESRFRLENARMKETFSKLSRNVNDKVSDEFMAMAKNYFEDATYFSEKEDTVRAFEAIVISWAYIDAGIKVGFFSVPDELKEYFTS